jgi:hypothetical protein
MMPIDMRDFSPPGKPMECSGEGVNDREGVHLLYLLKKKRIWSWVLWLTPVIPGAQETLLRKMVKT